MIVGSCHNIQNLNCFVDTGWKEAITADHVKLNLPSDSESSGCFQLQNENETNFDRGVVVNNGNTILINLEAPKSSANEAAGKTTTKFRTKFEKGAKIKYIPKLRTTTTTTT